MRAARQKSAPAFSGVVSRYTDLNGLALFALGPHRSKLSRARQNEYLVLTRNFIGRFFVRYSARISGNGIDVTSCTGPPRTPTVTAKLSGGQRVVFRLYRARRGYLVRDANISSVWLGQQMKSTFTGVINRNNGNIDALFSYLKQ